jgi:hypothetical protein
MKFTTQKQWNIYILDPSIAACVKITDLQPQWTKYICITTTNLDIIHLLVFYLNHNVSGAGFCPRLQVEPTQMGLIETTLYCAHLKRLHLKTETESSLGNVVFLNKRQGDG